MSTTDEVKSWDDILVIGIDNFFEFPINIRLATLVIPVGFLFILGGLVTNSWSESDTARFGLWNHCTTLKSFECCETIIDFLGSDSPGFVKATSAFHILGLFSAIGCGAVVIVTMCVSQYKDNTKINKLVWISYLITAFFLMLSVSIFGDNYHDEEWSKDHRLAGSFATAIIAFILFLCGGVAIIIISHQGANKVETVYIHEDGDPRPSSSLPEHYTWLSKIPIKTPRNWTKYDNSKRIDIWISHNSTVQLIPVSGKEWKAVENIVLGTWRKDLVGIGKDAKGLASLVYNSIVVTKIERVENPSLFEKYAENRAKLFRQIGARRRQFSSLENVDKVKKGKIATTKYVDMKVLGEIYHAVNEHYLFHGTPVQFIDAIISQGFDARLNKRGAFGPAVYAAESSTKSDSYADFQNERDQHLEKKMIMVRMLLGDIFVLNNREVFQRPPCKLCKNDRCADKSHNQDGSWLYDSVVVDGQWNFREFLIFELNRCYPEYIITYKRLWTD